MATSNRLFGNKSTISMATTQSKIFWLLRIYHFATAHHPIIYLLQIDQLFHHWKLSQYFITLRWKVVWQLHIANFDTFRRFIWLLRKAQFLGYCALYNYIPMHISQLYVYCKSRKHFTNWNRLNICLLCIEKLYDNFKSPIWKYFEYLYGYCAKTNFLATAHHTIIFLMHISQLYVYC